MVEQPESPDQQGAEARNTTVDRALRVLEAFLEPGGELGVLELSRQLELDKSVIHRILSTLVRRRFLEQDPTSRRYRVGLRTWELGRHYLDDRQLDRLAEAELTTIVHRHPYSTGYLASLDGGDVVVICSVRGQGPITLYIDPGTRMAAELTVTGRALLASLPKAERDRVVQRRRTVGLGGRNAVSLDELGTQLDSIEQAGVSISQGDYVPGIGTVAVPIRSAAGQAIAALSVDFLMAPETESLPVDLPGEIRASVAEIERVVAQG